MFGEPVVKGRGITVEQMLRKLSAEMTVDQILADHPHIAAEDVYAAPAFAANYLAQEETVVAGGAWQ